MLDLTEGQLASPSRSRRTLRFAAHDTTVANRRSRGGATSRHRRRRRRLRRAPRPLVAKRFTYVSADYRTRSCRVGSDRWPTVSSSEGRLRPGALDGFDVVLRERVARRTPGRAGSRRRTPFSAPTQCGSSCTASASTRVDRTSSRLRVSRSSARTAAYVTLPQLEDAARRNGLRIVADTVVEGDVRSFLQSARDHRLLDPEVLQRRGGDEPAECARELDGDRRRAGRPRWGRAGDG